MRRFCLSAAFALIVCSLALSQTSPTDPGATPAPSTAPVSTDAAKPQDQMPPDSKAPAPTTTAKPADSSSPAQATSAASSEPLYLTAGTDIRAALDTPLSTRTSKVGDRFTATISAPVHDSTGNVVIPLGAKLNGQISAPTDEKLAVTIKDMPHLNLRFTDIQLPDATDVPINATLISIHSSRPASASSMSNSHLTGSSAIAANGGFTGGLGHPIKGVAVGNLAGGGYVLSTSNKPVELPAECVLRLRVDRNTPVP